jgi:integron integrase
MTKQEMLTKASTVCQVRRLSRHTESSYLGWLARFADHSQAHASESREDRIRLFLEQLAPHSAAATQNQALNAIIFLYRDVLQQPLGDIGKWARAQRPKRLPVWLSAAEMTRLLDQMTGIPRLMAEMAFGSGLRLAELLALRIKDVDIDTHTITVRGGKGDKDRVTCLSHQLASRLGPHLERTRAQWERDRANGAAPIYLPDGLERKYPRAGCDWPWFWFWPANSESTDPRTKTYRRHHLHESTLGKALQRAARHAGLNKRITAHTLRHSFATAYLQNGGHIHDLQQLLGHSSIETTQIYTHCLPQLSQRITSPLDHLPTNIIPMSQAQPPSSAPPQQAAQRHA